MCLKTNNLFQNSIERLKSNLESSKQQIKEIQCSYKSKAVKLEAELTSKMAALCENQTLVNKQLSQALDQSSSYVNQIQVLFFCIQIFKDLSDYSIGNCMLKICKLCALLTIFQKYEKY